MRQENSRKSWWFFSGLYEHFLASTQYNVAQQLLEDNKRRKSIAYFLLSVSIMSLLPVMPVLIPTLICRLGFIITLCSTLAYNIISDPYTGAEVESRVASRMHKMRYAYYGGYGVYLSIRALMPTLISFINILAVGGGYIIFGRFQHPYDRKDSIFPVDNGPAHTLLGIVIIASGIILPVSFPSSRMVIALLNIACCTLASNTYLSLMQAPYKEEKNVDLLGNAAANGLIPSLSWVSGQDTLNITNLVC